jgi:hypothetical protein
VHFAFSDPCSVATAITRGGKSNRIEKPVTRRGVTEEAGDHGRYYKGDQCVSHISIPRLTAAAIASGSKFHGVEKPVTRRGVAEKTGDHGSNHNGDQYVSHVNVLLQLVF